jgi:hypothetical protein
LATIFWLCGKQIVGKKWRADRHFFVVFVPRPVLGCHTPVNHRLSLFGNPFYSQKIASIDPNVDEDCARCAPAA